MLCISSPWHGSVLTAITIENCFRKCGFLNTTVAVPEEPDEVELAIENWDTLGFAGSAHDFVTADDDLATCGVKTVEDIIDETTASEQAASNRKDDESEERSEQPTTTNAETLQAPDVQCVTNSSSLSDET